MSSVVIQPYCTQWPIQFEAERKALLAVFSPIAISVEHIGSTSVPGLAAKPVIDLLLGAATLAEIESKIQALHELGFLYVPKYESELPMRRYFVKSAGAGLRVHLHEGAGLRVHLHEGAGLRVHLHAVERGTKIWRDHLSFRDLLRTDELLRSQYQALKLRLAREFANDKSAYTQAKDPFISAVLAGNGPT